ncbi:MAG: hypothetical protein LBV60_18845 [Streptomyces sp.]|nr:hypothetical protein [Streptomyces sp.]
MTTDTSTAEATSATHDAPGPLRRRPSGRHRKPRPRRMALTVGGFALAAGALSLLRLVPESATGGSGTAQAEPRIGATTAVASGSADTVAAVPSARAASRSATAVMGGVSPSAPATARPSSSAPRHTDPATGIPEAPSTPMTPSETSAPPEPTTSAAPQPTPSPTTTTQAPDPATSTPGLCLPFIGLCLDDLTPSDD